MVNKLKTLIGDEESDVDSLPPEDEVTKKEASAEERQMRLQIQQEQEEAMRYAQAAHEENKRLKNVLSEGATLYNDTVKSKLDTELSQAQRAYKEAYESGDSDGMVEAQMKMAELVSEKREFSPFTTSRRCCI